MHCSTGHRDEGEAGRGRGESRTARLGGEGAHDGLSFSALMIVEGLARGGAASPGLAQSGPRRPSEYSLGSWFIYGHL